MTVFSEVVIDGCGSAFDAIVELSEYHEHSEVREAFTRFLNAVEFDDALCSELNFIATEYADIDDKWTTGYTVVSDCAFVALDHIKNM